MTCENAAIKSGYRAVVANYPVMRTPDGEYLVEVYRQRLSPTFWYRLRHGDNVIESLTITGVQRLLEEAGYSMADLDDAA